MRRRDFLALAAAGGHGGIDPRGVGAAVWPNVRMRGALASYGPGLLSAFRQVDGTIAKVLRGTDPADIPIEQPTTFALALNLKTAKALGLTIPTTLLARANEVIE